MRNLWGVALLCALVGCGGGSRTAFAPVSTWAGTYTGNLKFSGCPGTIPCGGDALSITISEAASGDGFSPALTITGNDSTSKEAISGSGTAIYTGTAPIGPGSSETTANATITPGGAIFLFGNGQSNTGPVLIQTIAVNNANTVNGSVVKGPLYFGTLTRSQ